MQIDREKCIACGFCVKDCPLQAVKIKDKVAVIDHQSCTNCGLCLRVCEQKAVSFQEDILAEAVVCDACPIRCQIRKGSLGACRRYQNVQGRLQRLVPLHTYDQVREIVGEDADHSIQRPLITGIGAGTTYPDCKPAPQIVYGQKEGIDVVTVVTEAPLSYSSIQVKVDTDLFIGREGAAVYAGKREVGMVETEQYGSKMLHVGGVNRLTGRNGFAAARTITDLANRKQVKLRIEEGSRLKVQVGRAPVIDGREVAKMRVGCGSATAGIFAPLLLQAADEVIILDSHITSQLSEHAAGKYAGARPTGLSLRFEQSTPGRYFGDHGKGWGGTSIEDPLKIIQAVDMNIAWPKLKVLITETTGQSGALFELDDKGTLQEISLSDKAREALGAISDTCEPSRVSALYMGGAGGSARAGVSRCPIKLTQMVHSRKAHLTIGGAPAFILPGGGINFLVDVQRVKEGFCYWTPTPATICPIEYTMKLQDYREMGGHLEAMKPFEALNPTENKDG